MAMRVGGVMFVALASSCAAVTPHDGPGVTTPGYAKPHGEVIDCAVDGGSRSIVLQRQGGHVVKLLTFSESKALIGQRLADPTSYFLRATEHEILVGSIVDRKTLLSSSKRAWKLPVFLSSDVRISRRNGHIFLIGTLSPADSPQTGMAAWELDDGSSAEPVRVALDSSVRQPQLFASQREIYAIGAQGLYRLQVAATQPAFELLIKGKFNRASAASLGDIELAAVVPAKMRAQRQVELRSLPDGKTVQTLKFPYRVASISMATRNDGQGMLLLRSRETVFQAQLVLLDRTGRMIQRKAVDYRMQLASGSQQGFVLVGPEEIQDVRLGDE